MPDLFSQNHSILRARPQHTVPGSAFTVLFSLFLAVSATSGALAAPDPVSGHGVDDTPQFTVPGFDLGHGQEGHFCGTDMTSPEARAAVDSFLAAKRAGLYPAARKGGFTPDVGDEQIFNVSESDWIQLNFRLVDKTSLYNLWVEIAEIDNGNVSSSDINSLRDVIHDATPSRSINPNQGIFANNHDVFGLPPDIDGDGVVDILMYDIGRGSGTTLGYVSAADAVLNPPEGQGNERDVLYLDSDQGTSNLSTLAVIAAHEYAHLIHLSYGLDNTFVTEGYAEYAMVMNGYYWRGVNFTGSITETTQPLFTWRDGGGPGAMDYERGGLLFTYLASRVGSLPIGQMMQGLNKKGGAGIDSVLAMQGESLMDLLLDYHIANHFNDLDIDPRFGYTQPERSFHHIPISAPPINGELTGDSGEGGFSYEFSEHINPGAAYLLRFNSVADFEFSYDNPTSPVFGDAHREQVLARNKGRLALKSADDGSITIHDLDQSEDFQRFDGRFDWAIFFFVHGKPDLAVGDLTRLNAFWTPLSEVTDVETSDQLPASWSLGKSYPNPFNPSTTVPVHMDRSRHVRLEVMDLLGRRMTVLNDGFLNAGTHTFNLDASGWSSGTYLIRMTAEDGIQTLPISLIK